MSNTVLTKNRKLIIFVMYQLYILGVYKYFNYHLTIGLSSYCNCINITLLSNNRDGNATVM